MKSQLKRNLRLGLTLIFTLSILISVIPARADEITDLENTTDSLQTQLDNINQELLSISNSISATEAQIESTNNELLRLQDSLAISRENEARQYDDMKSRIKFMYENDTTSLLEIMFSAESLSDFLNAADFIQSISEYDRERLEQLQEMKAGIEAQEASLRENQASLEELQKQLESQEAELTAKAKETSTDLAEYKQQLQALREEEARKAEEAAKKAAEEAAKKAAAANSSNSQSSSSSASSSSGGASSNSSSSSSNSSSGSSSSSTNNIYNYGTSGGVLTPEKGVVYYNGHRETYYSQKVLPGGGLNIPGRHVASDGTIRDADGYICVASSDLPWGTLVETSLGMGKVYDSGPTSGTIDIYTDW